MSVSKKNYVRLIRHGTAVSIGTIGTQRTVFSVKQILKRVIAAHKYAWAESRKNAKNSLFPEDRLKDDVEFTSAAREAMSDIVNNMGSPFSASETRKILEDIRDLNTPQKLEEAYYKIVRHFYNIPSDISTQAIKRVANAGHLKYTPALRMGYNESDSSRLKEWLRDRYDTRDATDEEIAIIDSMSFEEVLRAAQIEELRTSWNL